MIQSIFKEQKLILNFSLIEEEMRLHFRSSQCCCPGCLAGARAQCRGPPRSPEGEAALVWAVQACAACISAARNLLRTLCAENATGVMMTLR